jgi:ligand-binding sensor domain-containing protein
MGRRKSFELPAKIKSYRWLSQFSLVVFLMALAVAVRAQVTLPSVELINEKKGLPFNYVSNIVQDTNGFIWIAGPYGLCRYDGYSYWTLPSHHGDTTTLYSAEITGLAMHRNGTLWAGHREGRISIVNTLTGKVQRLQIPNTKGSYVRAIYPDSRGNVWLAVNGFGIYRYEKNQFQFVGQITNFPKEADPSTFYVLQEVNRFYESAQGTLWFCSNNGLYYILNDEMKHVSYVSENPKQAAFVENILAEGDSVFWLPTYGDGIVRYEIKSGRYIVIHF